jgi:hypothetical protein
MSGGSNSPNYSGSVFGDSAIEEDISCNKYSPNSANENRSRKSSTNVVRQQSDASLQNHRIYYQQKVNQQHDDEDDLNYVGSNYQKIPIRISTANEINANGRKRNSQFISAYNDDDVEDRIPIDSLDIENENYSSRIEIPPPPAQFQAQTTFLKNPLCRPQEINGNIPHPEFIITHHQPQSNRYVQQNRLSGHLISNIQIGNDCHSATSGSTKTAKTSSTSIAQSLSRNGSNADAYNNNWRKLQKTSRATIGDEFSTEL